jgi:hypothetical protein
METAAKTSIVRIEIWHALLLLTMVLTIGRSHLVEPIDMVIGGAFMGANFLLLSLGIGWVLTPLAGKGRVKAGVGLLILKMIIFLALLSVLFFRFHIDGLSFALGFSTLIVAILIEAARRAITLQA